MANRTDILTDADGNIIIKNGDLFVGDSDANHVEDILKASPGHYKQWLRLGAGILGQINGVVDNTYRRKVRLNLESDGYSADNVNISINSERL